MFTTFSGAITIYNKEFVSQLIKVFLPCLIVPLSGTDGAFNSMKIGSSYLIRRVDGMPIKLVVQLVCSILFRYLK